MHRTSLEYRNGIESFLKFAFCNTGGSKLIVCPYNKCKVGYNRCFTKELAHHLIFNDFGHNIKTGCIMGGISRPCSSLCDKGHNTTNTQLEIGF